MAAPGSTWKLCPLIISAALDPLVTDQEKLKCAAQHFHWSTNLGGIMLETGEFDAFNTIMAILRMRKKYPEAKPEEFYDLDQEFRDFTDCKPCESGGGRTWELAQCLKACGRSRGSAASRSPS